MHARTHSLQTPPESNTWRVCSASVTRQHKRAQQRAPSHPRTLCALTALALRWAPLTAAEESQHSTSIVRAPCKVFPDLGLPPSIYFSAARVGGRVFMYGGTTPVRNQPSTYSNTLRILHIASRRVEEHSPSLWRVTPVGRFPVMLTGHASCAIGRSVFLFGGLQTFRTSTLVGALLEPFTGSMAVWELNTGACLDSPLLHTFPTQT